MCKHCYLVSNHPQKFTFATKSMSLIGIVISCPIHPILNNFQWHFFSFLFFSNFFVILLAFSNSVECKSIRKKQPFNWIFPHSFYQTLSTRSCSFLNFFSSLFSYKQTKINLWSHFFSRQTTPFTQHQQTNPCVYI